MTRTCSLESMLKLQPDVDRTRCTQFPRWLVAALTLTLGAMFGSQTLAAERPNIVILLSDDMGWNELGFQGGKQVPTPNIDRLAKEGTKLSQFYVCSVCSPTRACLMTGRYPFRTGMEERSHGNDPAGMLVDERTIAQAMHEAGYFTAIIGKWHLGEWYKKHLPMQRGFDHQYGHYGALIDSYLHARDAIYDWHRDEQPINEPGYSTFLIADEFARVIEKQDGAKPFFIYVPFNAVHSPHQAPPEYVSRFRGNPEGAQLACLDVAVGRILETLTKKGVLDETLLFFLNDNGSPQAADNVPLRGIKGTTYEGGVRVPCVVRWPGKVKAGGEMPGMAHAVDLMPTLVNLVGGSLRQPLPLDGLDLWESIVSGKPSPRNELVLSVPEGPGVRNVETGQPSVRQVDWKLVDKELYNIREDPYEKHNVAADHPDQVKALTDRLAALVKERRPAESHQHTEKIVPMVYGEIENANPPAWMKEMNETLKKAVDEGTIKGGKPKDGASRKDKKKARLDAQ